MTPASPDITCPSEMPCWCEWYQYVPGSMSLGMSTRTGAVVRAGIVRSTLSEMPDGDTRKPWKWMLVGWSRSLRNVISIRSPCLTRNVGPMKRPSYALPEMGVPATVYVVAVTRRSIARTPLALTRLGVSLNGWPWTVGKVVGTCVP